MEFKGNQQNKTNKKKKELLCAQFKCNIVCVKKMKKKYKKK